MRKVGFIGACDKTDLIMYTAKALQYMDKKVLVVDSSLMQKTKYVVPAINPTKSYITDFEKIDFAVGFRSMTEVIRYLALKDETNEETLPYDYVLIDIDDADTLKGFGVEEIEKNYFVTSFDIYSLRKGVQILENLENTIKMTKVLYSYNMEKSDEEYLDYLSMGCKVMWNNFTLYLPKLDVDAQAIEENQRVQRIRIKKLTPEYQEGIIIIAQDILAEKNSSRIRKSIKE